MVEHDSRIRFEQYSFPILPGLIYAKDGNERIGELLFIDDSRERFQIYFESGMACLDMQICERHPEQFLWQEHAFENLKLRLCYSAQRCSKLKYFHAELIDNNGRVHILPGQICLKKPTHQLDVLCSFTALCELMDGLQYEPDPVTVQAQLNKER